MILAQPTSDEVRRLTALRKYDLLDAPPEQALDDLTLLASAICGTPIAIIALVDEHRQWFMSKLGTTMTETARDISFCGHAIHQRDLFIVPDAAHDERFADNPLVTGDFKIRFYAGAPLVGQDDAAIGAFSVMDHVPRVLTPQQEQALRVLGRQVMTQFELRRQIHGLVESEGKFRMLAETITDVFWITSPNLNQVHYVSPGFELIWGRKPEEIYAHPHQWFDAILPEDRPRVREAFARLMEHAPKVGVEYRIVRPDGSIRWIHDRGFQVRDAAGHLVRLTGTASDITARKTAELESLHLAAIVEFSNDAIIGEDLDGRITGWNRSAEKLFGYSAGEMVGTSIMRLVPADRQEDEKQILEKVRRGEIVEHFETLRRTKEGRLINVSLAASPIKNAAGEPISVSNVAHNITERKQAEEMLRLVSLRESTRKRRKVYQDLGVIALSSVLVFVIGWYTGFFDWAFHEVDTHDLGPADFLDETVGTSIFFSLAMLVFSCRRWRESQAEVLSQTQVAKALGLMHTEMEAQVRQRTAELSETNENLRREMAERQHAQAVIKQFPAIIESSDDAIISKTLQGIITSWNPSAERMFGYAATEIIGKPITLLFPTDRLQEETDILSRITRGERVQHFETVRVRKDGRSIDVSVTISPIKDAEGKITGVSKIVRDVTEQKRAQLAALRLGAIVEYSDDAIIGKDLNGIITSWNQGAEKVFGYSAGEMVGTSIMRLIPPDRQDEEALILGKIKSGESVEHFETLRLTKHGRLIDISLTASPIKDAAGKPIGVSKVARDISERRQTEKTLHNERDFIAKVVDTVGSLVVVIDRQANIVRFNRACEQLTGYPFKEVEGRNLIDLLILPEERATTTQEFNNLCAGQFPNTYENHWVDREGNPRVIAWSNTALVDANGEVEFVIGTGTDVTERKLAEERIAEQAALLDKARDAILVRDLEGKILYWNSGAERMYGWARQEVVGSSIGALLYADPKKFEEVNALTISQGEWHGELQHLNKDRREITIEARWTLIRDDQGNPKSVLAINTDITDKKKLEAQFMRAQRMESIGTLAGGVAHDLNNILAPIMMSIDILKDISTDPQAAQILETIDVSARRGADIVRQVLSFARGMEGERIEVQPKHLFKDLEHIIKDTFPKDIRLHFFVPATTWTIMGDPTQIHQILLNLCVNARDAMPNGGDLTISVENTVLDEQYAAMNIQTQPGSYVMIAVTDSGTGMPQNIQEKIFEPFFTTKDLHKGTGLGLSTVMAIVKSHGGIINVYSEPGRGTTFKVYLPALDSSFDAWADRPEIDKLPRGNGETILVVDDETSILSITRQTLEAFGYRVLTATNGAVAVAVYAENKQEIALVLTDMMMPIMDGASTIHALTRINPAVKIAAASGLNSNGEEGRAAGIGIKHFLTKPYTAAKLLKTIRAILTDE